MNKREIIENTLNNARQALSILESRAAVHTISTIPTDLKMDLEAKRMEVDNLEDQLNKLDGDGLHPPTPLVQGRGTQNPFGDTGRITDPIKRLVNKLLNYRLILLRMYSMSSIFDNPTFRVSVLILVLSLGGVGIYYLLNSKSGNLCNSTTRNDWMQKRMSCGEIILLTENEGQKENQGFNDDKQKGVEAFAKKDYDTAINSFRSALSKQKNAPETLIYLNNATAAKSKKAHLIAVPVPIGKPKSEISDSALEMLRGFAQAQDQINRAGGINGRLLQFAIINDDNDPKNAKQIASELVKMKEVLGVIGHYSSDTTSVVAPIYREGKLVLITPISTADDIGKDNDYVFRTNINTITGAKALFDHMLNKWKSKKVAIFYDKGVYGEALKNSFTQNVYKNRNIVEIVNEFDLSKLSPNAEQELQKAREGGADVLLLIPGLNQTRDKALDVINANRKQLKILGDIANLYRLATLNNGEKSVGMVMAVSWNFDEGKPSGFADSAKNLWGARVNWSTAMSYDAAQAMKAAIERRNTNTPPTRETVQQALSNPELAAPGTSGPFYFEKENRTSESLHIKKGDRSPQPLQLVEIRPNKSSRPPYNFESIK